ncbi:molybdate ABC transporter substrate-binding protein [Campylobacter fetus]|uniref:Molybdate ABC transporter substrate-binding protein n=3 Tax=Campylobacter fetus TaxID=196 RepID=A0A5L4XIK1_CAMFE|nr:MULTISPECIES: molybdate ABC transporter substrate-binding protein [Campylobacter]OCS23060.1 molybdate ABC transporter substrate-binding protein [Campylobacter fetus subsp. venerealis cfvi97/532]OCS27255.1 molybdate ABC transporter substrate-binding protein [Campylobacter fetus subsp. venerealis cfvB10]OCS30360.1 molybdate ABC transporter substrate-binding protein [Campylobacter fetus subsp. venerealis LMG 6570 = CCUG 33900]OCS42662.1 molybdate ABC transporter substrate-binding protein [Campy
MKKLLLIVAFVIVGFASELNVAAAANTTYAFEDIKKEFKKLYPDANLNVSLGSSGKLVAQIKNGAPFELFMSADMNYANTLYKDGFALNDAVIYAKGKVAMLSVRGFDVTKGLEVLKDPKIKTIVIANPKTAPYGAASIEAFKNAGIYDAIKDKIVEAGSIGEALSQTLKAGDIGFVAASAMYSPKMAEYKEGKEFNLVDSKLYTTIDQGIVILKNGEKNKLAKDFYDFILGEKGKEIFAKYGYEF